MSAYFIVMISMDEAVDRAPYDSYIALVKPIVERFGGEYLVLSLIHISEPTRRSSSVFPTGRG